MTKNTVSSMSTIIRTNDLTADTRLYLSKIMNNYRFVYNQYKALVKHFDGREVRIEDHLQAVIELVAEGYMNWLGGIHEDVLKQAITSSFIDILENDFNFMSKKHRNECNLTFKADINKSVITSDILEPLMCVENTILPTDIDVLMQAVISLSINQADININVCYNK